MENEKELLNYYTCDLLGEKFETTDGRLIRRITRENKALARDMFQCGLIDELMKKNLIPKIKIAEESVGFMYIEEEKIPYVVYPHEWSLYMLYTAAKCVLNVNEIALKYGYQLMDPHTYNIVFKGIFPRYVDLGSFQKVNCKEVCWHGKNIFLRDYIFPLRIASAKHGFSAPGIAKGLTAYSQDIDVIEYVYLFSGKFPKKLVRFYWKTNNMLHKYFCKVKRKLKGDGVSDICRQYTDDTKKLRRILMTYNINDNGKWSDYHDSMQLKKGDRFDQLCEMLQNIGLKTSIEVGGNQGLFSNMLVERGIVERALCSDYDGGAIDKAFITRRGKGAVYYASFNIMDTIEMGWMRRAERFKSDIVIVLALSHHLVLAQKVRLQSLFKILTEYTNRYILIEFMPLGLWDGKSAVKVPEWYTLEWFKKEMSTWFEIIQTVQTERNRIALLGILR